MDDDTGAENRLRELLGDQRWSLPSRPDAVQRIQRAARRQRVKAASTAAGTAAAIAVTAIAVPLASSGTQATQATQATRTPSAPGSSVHASTPSKTHRVMPLLVGLSLHEAEATISKAVPRVHIRVRHSDANVPVDIVVQEIPAGGSKVDPGTTVVLVVSGR